MLLTTNKACVVPVAAHDALAWAAGKISDLDLLTLAPLVPECVFIVDLPDRTNYRQILRLVKHWREQGAFFLIARTGYSCSGLAPGAKKRLHSRL